MSCKAHPTEAQVSRQLPLSRTQLREVPSGRWIRRPILSSPDELIGEDYLSFAGIPPACASAIPKAQQFAEKIHAYTRPWSDRQNTRTRDLIDLVLFLTIDAPSADDVRAAVTRTFAQRATHEVPAVLPEPPPEWAPIYEQLAAEAALRPQSMPEGYQILNAFWTKLQA